jgi:hypothetical protein
MFFSPSLSLETRHNHLLRCHQMVIYDNKVCGSRESSDRVRFLIFLSPSFGFCTRKLPIRDKKRRNFFSQRHRSLSCSLVVFIIIVPSNMRINFIISRNQQGELAQN